MEKDWLARNQDEDQKHINKNPSENRGYPNRAALEA